MKTTIRTVSRQILVEPAKLNVGSVVITVTPIPMDELGMCITLTQEQVGALLFALEQAAEAAKLRFDREQSAIVGNRASLQAMEDRAAL